MLAQGCSLSIVFINGGSGTGRARGGTNLQMTISVSNSEEELSMWRMPIVVKGG